MRQVTTHLMKPLLGWQCLQLDWNITLFKLIIFIYVDCWTDECKWHSDDSTRDIAVRKQSLFGGKMVTGIYNVQLLCLMVFTILKRGGLDVKIITQNKCLPPWTLSGNWLYLESAAEEHQHLSHHFQTTHNTFQNRLKRHRRTISEKLSAWVHIRSRFHKWLWITSEWMNSDHSLTKFKKNQRLHRYPNVRHNPIYHTRFAILNCFEMAYF